MRCPACTGTLQQHTVQQHTVHDKIEVHVCDACTGTLVAVNKLVPLLQTIAAPLRHAVDRDEPIEPIPDTGGRRRCPKCGGAFEAFGYMGTNLVTADRCGSCALIWTDPDELGTMALLYLRTSVRTAERERSVTELGESMARTTRLALSARAHANRVASGLLRRWRWL